MYYVVTQTIMHPCGGTIVEKGQTLYIEQIQAIARETGIDSLFCVLCLTPEAARSIVQDLRT